MNPRTRTDKNGEPEVDAERFWAARHEGRRRTIFYSVIAAGLVSLTIGWAIERQAYNEQAERSQHNCELTARVSNLLVVISRDVSETAPAEEIRERWAEYAEVFDDAIPPEADSCAEVFPERAPIPFIE